jgi:hypothetical protein
VFQVSAGFEIAFIFQEILPSSLYIYLFYQFAHGGSFEKRDEATMILLIMTQMAILLCDIAMTVLNYIHFYVLRMVLVPFTYAIKLRLEFVVLNRLADRGGVRET